VSIGILMGCRGQGQIWDGMALRIPLCESEKICLKSMAEEDDEG
jgi:hypothetical protein